MSMSRTEIKVLRKAAARRKRRIVYHSDGRSMTVANMVFYRTTGAQVDAYTYSLVHQFNLCRCYRSKVGQEETDVQQLYGDGPDDLATYVGFCHRNNADALWAMRMNDTHDFSASEIYRERFQRNRFKQEHPDWLVGTREHQPPHGRWSAVDFAQPGVRERAFRLWEEVCTNYDVDGLLIDFFRHPTFFRSTAWGDHASEEELGMMTGLFRRAREMMDAIGAERGRPLLMSVRTPDSPGFCRGLGLDIETWMEEDLIDAWLPTGYFRLREWTDIVATGRKHGVPVWASMSESRIAPREVHNSVEAYRARAMNMWHAGVDAIYLFNFAPRGSQADPHGQLLHELGDPNTLATLDKMYVPDARGHANVDYWLRGGNSFYDGPGNVPQVLVGGKAKQVNLLVGDDVAAARAQGYAARTELRLRFAPLKKTLFAARVDDAPVIDGKLDDACWRQADTAKDFTVIFDADTAAAHQTTGRAAYDDEYLYVAVDCDEPRMDLLREATDASDGAFHDYEGEMLHIFVDPDRDRTTFFYMRAHTNGSWTMHGLDGGAMPDAPIETAVHFGDDRFSIEAKIPLALLDVAPAPGRVIGFNLCRDRAVEGVSGTTGKARDVSPNDVHSLWQNTFGAPEQPVYFGNLEFADGPAGGSGRPGGKPEKPSDGDTLSVTFNGKALGVGVLRGDEVSFEPDAALVRKGANCIELAIEPADHTERILTELQLWMRYAQGGKDARPGPAT